MVYIGEWPEGFFAMAAVGATNVGSIKVFHDQVRYCHSGYVLLSPGGKCLLSPKVFLSPSVRRVFLPPELALLFNFLQC